MKIKFTDTAYTLITRELVDAKLDFTFMKDGKSSEFIMDEIAASSSITIMEDDGTVDVEYEGFSDLMVIREYMTGAVAVTLINNFILAQTMEFANRVDNLEANADRANQSIEDLGNKTDNLTERADGFDESQDNQDELISDIIENG